MRLKEFYISAMHQAIDNILEDYAFIEIMEYVENGNSYDLLDFIYENGFYNEREKEVRCLMFNENTSFLLSLISMHKHLMNLIYTLLEFYIEDGNYKKEYETMDLIKEITGVD